MYSLQLVEDYCCRRFVRKQPHNPPYLHVFHCLKQADGVRRATPLLLVLVCIELSDVIFAVDSIPAVFAVTKVMVAFAPPLLTNHDILFFPALYVYIMPYRFSVLSHLDRTQSSRFWRRTVLCPDLLYITRRDESTNDVNINLYALGDSV